MLGRSAGLLQLLGAGLRAVEPAAAGLLPGTAAAAAAAAVSTSRLLRGLAGQAGSAPQHQPEEHHHHEYADSHRVDEAATYRVGAGGRVEAHALKAPRRQQFVTAQRLGMEGPQGPPPADLHNLAAQFGVRDAGAFVSAVQRLRVDRQHGLLAHAAGVVEHLQGLGLGGELVGRMMQCCPALFSYPAEERAEVLMGELMGARVGKTAEQAGELFVRCPALANTRHVLPSIVKLVAEHHTD